MKEKYIVSSYDSLEKAWDCDFFDTQEGAIENAQLIMKSTYPWAYVSEIIVRTNNGKLYDNSGFEIKGGESNG